MGWVPCGCEYASWNIQAWWDFLCESGACSSRIPLMSLKPGRRNSMDPGVDPLLFGSRASVGKLFIPLPGPIFSSVQWDVNSHLTRLLWSKWKFIKLLAQCQTHTRRLWATVDLLPVLEPWPRAWTEVLEGGREANCPRGGHFKCLLPLSLIYILLRYGFYASLFPKRKQQVQRP